jgi:hypothetical protein
VKVKVACGLLDTGEIVEEGLTDMADGVAGEQAASIKLSAKLDINKNRRNNI